MELDWIWKAALIFIVGTVILRIGGRKSISQMTISQTVVMIGLGSLLVDPIARKGLLITFLGAFILVILMIITEYIGVKVDRFEGIFVGKAVIVIEDGKPNIKNLKKLRLSIDRLETRIRQAGIASIEDIKYGTIEVSGQLGYELMDNKKPLTKGDFERLMSEIYQLKEMFGRSIGAGNENINRIEGDNIFKEIKYDTFEGNKNEP